MNPLSGETGEEVTRRSATRRTATWLPADYAAGRRAPRSVYGKISGRTQIGFAENDWRFVQWLAQEYGETVSDVVRQAVQVAREDCEKNLAGDGIAFPWIPENTP